MTSILLLIKLIGIIVLKVTSNFLCIVISCFREIYNGLKEGLPLKRNLRLLGYYKFSVKVLITETNGNR